MVCSAQIVYSLCIDKVIDMRLEIVDNKEECQAEIEGEERGSESKG